MNKYVQQGIRETEQFDIPMYKLPIYEKKCKAMRAGQLQLDF